MALGKPADIVRGSKHEYAILGFFDFKPGKIVDIIGLEEARKLDGVRDADIERNIGDILENANDDRSRCGYYIVYGDTREQVEELEQKVKSIVKVVTE